MLRRMIIALSPHVLLLLMTVAGVSAQQLEVPQRDRDKVAPEEQRSRPRMPGADLYPHQAPAPNEPGFVAPLTKETATGRMGVAGWTSPNPRVGARGASDSQDTGWLGIGFGVVWGGFPRGTMTR
jgi:hypothetical protein